MARTAKYTKALPVYVTAEVRRRLDNIAETKAISLAEVIRDIIDVGLDDAETRWFGEDD